MSSNGKARNAPTLAQQIIEMQQQIQFLKSRLRERGGFASVETKPIGTAGGQSAAAGSSGFLRTEGDTMIGPIAYFPKLLPIDLSDNSLNVARDFGAGFSSRVIVSAGVPGSDIDTIHGAVHAGQILMLQGILTEQFTIKHGIGNIRTFDAADLVVTDNQNVWLVFDAIANEWAAIGGAGTSGTGTNISAAMNADQTTNLLVNDHVEFDNNVSPKGHAGGIVLQTGAGQLDGIFELKQGKTYFLSAGVKVDSSVTPSAAEFVWYDITNTAEIGLRAKYDNTAVSIDQPKAEIIFTPSTDVTVELRLMAKSGTIVGWSSDSTFAHIFEFSGKNGADGAPGADGSPSWKSPVRACAIGNVANIATFTVLQDGVTLVEDDRVLLTQQTAPAENGIYDVGVVAAGLAPLTRSSDLDITAELTASIFVAIEEGTTKENTLWQLTSNNPMTIGSSAQVWAEFVPGGTGITIPGAAGTDGKDASGTFIGDGRQGVIADNLSRLQAFKNCRGPQGDLGSFFLIPNDGYDHGDFGGPPPPPTELNPQEVLVTVGSPSGSAFGGNTTSSRSLNYGETWVANNDLGDERWQQLTYDPVGRILLCIAPFTFSFNTLGRSTTKGASWGSSDPFGADTPLSIIWVASLSLFVVVTNTTGTNAIWTSPDGSAWTQRTTAALSAVLPATAARANSIVYSPFLGKIFAFGTASTEFHSSTDGINWIKESFVDVIGDTHFNSIAKRVVWSEGQRKFLLITSITKTNGTYESSDMKTWTKNSPIPQLLGSTTPTDLIWMPAYSVWIMAGATFDAPTGLRGIWQYSFDGDLWTPVPGKEFRAFETDYDESFLASEGGSTHICFSPSFGYVFGFNASANTTSNDYRRCSFSRTNVYFNNQNSQFGGAAGSYPNIYERDFTQPR